MEKTDSNVAYVLVVDDEDGLRTMLSTLFQREGYHVDTASGLNAALTALERDADRLDVILTDLSMPDGSGLVLLERARALSTSLQVVMMTAYATMDEAVKAMRVGAYDYIQKPFRNDALKVTVEKAVEKTRLIRQNEAFRFALNHQAAKKHRGLLGQSPAIKHVMQLIEKSAQANINVLVTGESGTGKELVARALHDLSPRMKAPFVVVNCGALPEQLMESELFGHEKGAFTGAQQRQEGLMRAADGGTLFLDEVGELPAPLQVKLLRALQEKAIRPVGSTREYPVDVRLVAATNRDIEFEVKAGKFREDLYYRLNVFPIHLPPLRERAGDIALLSEAFLEQKAAQMQKQLRWSREAMQWLRTQKFPGNVRELENLIERAALLASEPEVTLLDLGAAPLPMMEAYPTPRTLPDKFDLDEYLQEIEKDILLQVLRESNQQRTVAAQRLNTTARSLRYRLSKYGLTNDSEVDEST